jgi:disease resistance protein RPM1
MGLFTHMSFYHFSWKVDGASLKELRVVSIVGFGGLGKTTLANEVYRDLRDNLSGNPEKSFSCKAIISVSQKPDMNNLLKSLFSKVSGQSADHTYDLQGLIDIVREYLKGKRYLSIFFLHSLLFVYMFFLRHQVVF